MIIKINVNDNDFAEKIEDILETKVNGLIFITDEYFNKQLDELKDKDALKMLENMLIYLFKEIMLEIGFMKKKFQKIK